MVSRKRKRHNVNRKTNMNTAVPRKSKRHNVTVKTDIHTINNVLNKAKTKTKTQMQIVSTAMSIATLFTIELVKWQMAMKMNGAMSAPF